MILKTEKIKEPCDSSYLTNADFGDELQTKIYIPRNLEHQYTFNEFDT